MSIIRDRLRRQYQQAVQSVRTLPVARSEDRALLRLSSAASARQRRGTPTVLVHGYKDDATVFEPLADYLHESGFHTHAVTLAPSDCSVPIEPLAQQLASYIDSVFAADQKLDFVGFSLGGIVVRYYVQRMGGLARTGRFLSVATPHRGTWLAYVSRLPGALQLRPNSDFLRDLNSDAERLGGVRFASMWTPLDLMILPSFSSRMSVGENLRVWSLQHQGLITSRRGIHAIAEHLLGNEKKLPRTSQSNLGSRAALSR